MNDPIKFFPQIQEIIERLQQSMPGFFPIFPPVSSLESLRAGTNDTPYPSHGLAKENRLRYKLSYGGNKTLCGPGGATGTG